MQIEQEAYPYQGGRASGKQYTALGLAAHREDQLRVNRDITIAADDRPHSIPETRSSQTRCFTRLLIPGYRLATRFLAACAKTAEVHQRMQSLMVVPNLL